MMIIDIDSIKNGSYPEIIIIGSGPAGISLALRLEELHISSLILEAGDESYSQQSQKFYEGTVVGDRYFNLDIARLRQMGGSSGHWGGWSRPLDAEDFLPREDLPNMGWPITKRELNPYLDRAASIIDTPIDQEDKPLTSKLKQISFFIKKPPTRFAEKYGNYIQDSRLIHLVLRATVDHLVSIDGKIKSAEVIDHQGHRFSVQGGIFVVCCGGIENSRLLLWSNQASPEKVVLHDNALGKYWMEHPVFTIGEAVLTSKFANIKKHSATFFSPTYEAMRDSSTLNAGLRLQVGDHSLVTLKETIRDIACIAPRWGRWVAAQFDKQLVCGAHVRMAWEQYPVATNRCELSEEKDANGVPLVRLFWKKSPLEKKTALKTLEFFGQYLISINGGRVRAYPWLLDDSPYPEFDELAGFHHMGGTRMSSDPKKGVVDANLKVFGQPNLFISGSSVFPTGGHANPTLTIIQLSLRLGDHLSRIV